jgi:glycosyltransferase involved in cell wall biosynthesis
MNSISQPLVTIITVVYNGEKLIEDTILSVINQTYKNLEYIIIDGASKDMSVDIIRKYDKYINYWISENDFGIYDAMNKGISFATGEWINFMNCGDTFYSKTIIEDIFRNEIDKEISIIYGDTVFRCEDVLLLKKAENINILNGRMPMCHQSTFTRRNILIQNLYSITYLINSDYEFYYNRYKENIEQFIYIPIPFSIIDTTGLTNINNLIFRSFVEKGIINKKIYSIKYIIYLIYIYVRSITKDFLPSKLILNFRKNIYKRILI